MSAFARAAADAALCGIIAVAGLLRLELQPLLFQRARQGALAFGDVLGRGDAVVAHRVGRRLLPAVGAGAVREAAAVGAAAPDGLGLGGAGQQQDQEQ